MAPTPRGEANVKKNIITRTNDVSTLAGSGLFRIQGVKCLDNPLDVIGKLIGIMLATIKHFFGIIDKLKNNKCI